MSENVSTKSLALFVTNKTITFLTKTIQQDEVFYSEVYTVTYATSDNELNLERILGIIKSKLALLLYYDKIVVCYQTSPISIVPKSYFKVDLAQKYQFLSDTENDFFATDCSKISSTILFKQLNPIHTIFNDLPNYKHAIYTHTSKLLIQDAKVNQEKIQIFIQIINQKLELCIYNKGNFTLYNIYDIINQDDIVYYILNSIQQHNLDPTQIELVFENEITANHPITAQLQKYVNRIIFNHEFNLAGPKYLLYKIFECE